MSKNKEALKTGRPLSPHLSIYKLQISSLLSIGHRLSGVALFGMFSILAWSFVLWVFSDYDQCYLSVFDNRCCKYVMIFVSYVFFYHLSTGIRHLFWDTGINLSIKGVRISGIIAIISSIILTFVYWVIL